MQEKIKIKKSQINPKQIKANIYDTIELIVDIKGITNKDLEEIENELKELFKADDYNLFETELYEDEINKLCKRKASEMSVASKKRLLEKESVLRFISRDETERISICRLFVSIKLDYKAIHSLSKKIELMNSIIKCFSQIEYFYKERITINKVDSLVCSSLYKLYQCFDKSMFGDIAYKLNRNNNISNIKEQMLKNESYFEYDNNEIIVQKFINNGILNSDDRKTVYQGIMNVTASYDCLENNDVKVKDKMISLNDILFIIFINHITESFANDLINGETNKILEGFNKNE